MAESRISAAALVVAVLVMLAQADVGSSQVDNSGLVRFSNKSKGTAVTISDLSNTLESNLAAGATVEFNQSKSSNPANLFQITNSKSKALIANLVVRTGNGYNVSFIDVDFVTGVVLTVGF